MPKLTLLLVSILCVLITVSASFAQDTDRDGISDQVEQTILETYRPWLYFDHDETVWPCSATWFVQHSRMIHNPCGDIEQSVLQANPRMILQTGSWGSGYKYSTLKLDLDDEFRTGQFPDNPLLSTNVAIYGHVMPLSDYPESSLSYPEFPTNFANDYIVAQYWILFPYNDAHFFDNPLQDNPGDHEGDWVWIDVLLDKATTNAQYVVYHHHGDNSIPPSVKPWVDVEKTNGSPVVYLEKGTHELWPNAGEGSFFGSERFFVEPHFGNGQRFQPNTVINLGEVGRPMQRGGQAEQLDRELALLYNGEWGDFTGEGFDVGIGPEVNTSNPPGPVNQRWGEKLRFPALPSKEQLKIFDLGPASLISQLTALNNRGQVLGYLCNNRSFVWENGFSRQLSAPTNVCSAFGFTITEGGAVCGNFYCYLGQNRPVVWSNPGSYSIAQIFYVTNSTPVEGYWGDAFGISITDLHDTAAGLIGVGGGQYGSTYRLAGNKLYLQEFSPPFPGPLPPAFNRGNINGNLIGSMNNNGWVVALSADPANYVTVLSPTNGTHSAASSINDAGDIAGNVGGESVLWRHDGIRVSLWRDSSGGHASWINNRGEIIGDKSPEGAVIWQTNSLIQVADLVGANSDWVPLSVRATRINDNGWIIGTANNRSIESHAIVVVLAPVIETFSEKTVFRAADAVISAKVFGALPLNLQWRKNGTNLVDGGRISGTQTPTLTIQAATAADQGDYQLEVANQFGTASSAVRIDVKLPPISISRSNSLLVVSGSTPNTVLQHATNPAGPWVPIPGASGPFMASPTNRTEFFRTSAP